MTEADRRDGGRGPRGNGISDEEIDLAVRGMLDRQPSASFSRQVVGRLHEGRRPLLANAWRPALAAAVILLIAAGVWTTINRRAAKGPWPTIESQLAKGSAGPSRGDRELPSRARGSGQPAAVAPHAQVHQHFGGPSTERHETTVAQRHETPPEPRPGVHRLAIGGARLAVRAPGSEGAASSTVATAEAPVDLLPAVPPIEMAPLDTPPPVVIHPVVVAPIEIPDIAIPPVPDPGSKPVETSPGSGQGQKRRGASTR